MATAVLRTPTTFRPTATTTNISSSSHKFQCVSFANIRETAQQTFSRRFRIRHSPPTQPSSKLPHRLLKFLPFASNGEAADTRTADTVENEEQIVVESSDSEVEENSDGAVGVEEVSSDSDIADAEETISVVVASLQSYREALSSNNEQKAAEIEAFLRSIEEEKIGLEKKVAALSEELTYEKERVLRISADFDNFRKRTERERLSLVTNAQGEVVENFLPVLDNFERAKSQIKVESEGEEKINNSYQSIYKQFVEILGVLGVVPVETVGKPFDPLLHEAIMQEDSTEFEEGVIIEQYRKGFQLGDRLLRPAMVKVSSGPGPAKKPEIVEEQEDSSETSEVDTAAPESAEN